MEINSNGSSTNNFSQNLNENVEQMKTSLGSNFAIKAESVAANILTATSLMARDLEEQFAYLLKQFDPETAEEKFQDALYARLNLERIKYTPTTFKVTVSGVTGFSVGAEYFWLQDVSTNDLFFNSQEFVFDEDEQAEVVFEASRKGPVNVSKKTKFDILLEDENIFGIDFSTMREIQIGTYRESDSEFRKRFNAVMTSNKKSTRNAILANLSEKTGGRKFVSIYDCNSDSDIQEGCIQIIARPTVSDEEFGKLILDNVIAGINFLGNTTVDVPLSNGQTWEVKFQKATAVPVDLYIKTNLLQTYYENSIFHRVRNNILAYLETHVFGLKSPIWATEFIVPTLEVDGVSSVMEIQIKRHDDQTYTGSIFLARDEYPVFEYDNINLAK